MATLSAVYTLLFQEAFSPLDNSTIRAGAKIPRSRYDHMQAGTYDLIQRPPLSIAVATWPKVMP